MSLMGPPRVQAGVPGTAPRTGGPGELGHEKGRRPAGAAGLPGLSPSSQGGGPLGSSCPRPQGPPGLQPYLIVLTHFHSVIELPPRTLASPTCFQGLSGASPQGQGAPRDRGSLSLATGVAFGDGALGTTTVLGDSGGRALSPGPEHLGGASAWGASQTEPGPPSRTKLGFGHRCPKPGPCTGAPDPRNRPAKL